MANNTGLDMAATSSSFLARGERLRVLFRYLERVDAERELELARRVLTDCRRRWRRRLDDDAIDERVRDAVGEAHWDTAREIFRQVVANTQSKLGSASSKRGSSAPTMTPGKDVDYAVMTISSLKQGGAPACDCKEDLCGPAAKLTDTSRKGGGALRKRRDQRRRGLPVRAAQDYLTAGDCCQKHGFSSNDVCDMIVDSSDLPEPAKGEQTSHEVEFNDTCGMIVDSCDYPDLAVEEEQASHEFVATDIELSGSDDGESDDNMDTSYSQVDDEFESDYEYGYESSSSDADCCDSIAFGATSLFNQEPAPCPICRDDKVEEGRAIVLPGCSHSFCVECFDRYVESQIGNGNAEGITCPFVLDGQGCGAAGRRCDEAVGPEVLREIMTEEGYGRLARMRDAAFVRKNADYDHCPTPDCANIVLCRSVSLIGNAGRGGGGGNRRTAEARICDCFRCGHTSCLTCGARPFHSNETCEEHAERGRRENAGRVEATYRVPAPDEAGAGALDGMRRCRRCGNGVEIVRGGCVRVKCLCGHRFCCRCGSENGRCDCSSRPARRGFADDVRTGCGGGSTGRAAVNAVSMHEVNVSSNF